MKKCPRCMEYDSDTIRFCKRCGTELFFEERFEKRFEKPFENAEKKNITERHGGKFNALGNLARLVKKIISE